MIDWGEVPYSGNSDWQRGFAMKKYLAVLITVCFLTGTGSAGAFTQSECKANSASDFEDDLNAAGDELNRKECKGGSANGVIPSEIGAFLYR